MSKFLIGFFMFCCFVTILLTVSAALKGDLLYTVFVAMFAGGFSWSLIVVEGGEIRKARENEEYIAELERKLAEKGMR